MSGALVVEDVGKSFATRNGPVAALDGVSFEMESGEFLSVIGPPGCGKSTLFGIIGGLIAADRGRVLVDGARVRGVHGEIGMVFKEDSTFPWRTALENVAFPLEIGGLPKAARMEKARELLRLLGLEGFEHRYPGQLSGGMRQCTAIARSLAAEPKILLMDEPFAALDEPTRLLLGDQLMQVRRTLNPTTLLVTHNITEAVRLSDRVLVMTCRPGRVRRIVNIDLPRPRGSELLGSPDFARLVGAIWSDLREEAARGMPSGHAPS